MGPTIRSWELPTDRPSDLCFGSNSRGNWSSNQPRLDSPSSIDCDALLLGVLHWAA